MAVDLGPGNPPGGGQITIAAGSGTRTSSSVDLLGYQYVTGYWVTQGAGSTAIALQYSTDNATWSTVTYSADMMSTSGSWQTLNMTQMAQTGMMSFVAPMFARYVRLSTTATTTGTYTMQVVGSNAPPMPSNSTSFTTSVKGLVSPGDSSIGPGSSLPVVSYAMGFRGTAAGYWDRIRVPSIVKSGIFSAGGNNALWTPTTGLKFRLMRYKLNVSTLASHATGTDIVFQFNDGNTNSGIVEACYVPATSSPVFGSWSTGWVDLGNGYLSSTVNNVLNLNLNTPFVNGQVRVVCCGMEE